MIRKIFTSEEMKTYLANQNFNHFLLRSSRYLQEFEVIAQIKLLQLASNNYSFTQDSHFREWFAGVEKLSEAERLVVRSRHLFIFFSSIFVTNFIQISSAFPIL